MNYLAHIFLSAENDQLRIGNFIADAVKGKDFVHFPEGIRNGILLHRAIDTYTDLHPTFRKSSGRLFKRFRHYNGVIVDIFYDHFLAANWDNYSGIPLERYVLNFYQLLERYFELLPQKVQDFYPYMRRDNWLFSYRSMEGIEKILRQMTNRSRSPLPLDYATAELNQYYELFQKEFETFFPQLVAFTQSEIEKLKLDE